MHLVLPDIHALSFFQFCGGRVPLLTRPCQLQLSIIALFLLHRYNIIATLHLLMQLAHFSQRLFIFLVYGGFLPATEHDDEVEFRQPVLAHSICLRLSERGKQIVLLIFASLMHQLQISHLVTDHRAHVLVREHGGTCFLQLGGQEVILLHQVL